MISVLMSGCNGKMGQIITKLCSESNDIKIVAGISRQHDKYNNPYPVFSSFENLKMKADVVIDFSNPDILPSLLKYCINTKTALVLATTGYSDNQLDMIRHASEIIPIFKSANMSLGINVLMELLSLAASTLGQTCDIEIIEKHHNEKKDAPSGTALMLADEINNTLNSSKHYIYDRTASAKKRDTDEIGIASIRGGTINGEHTVLFAGKDEVIEIKHTALSRDIFGIGAIKAAQYISTKENGIYNMKNLLSEMIK